MRDLCDGTRSVWVGFGQGVEREGMNETVMGEKDKLSPRIYRRMEDRKAWDAYWQ
ncbi:unnamed protein product, partial [Wuchereria bancrofti]